MLPIWKLVNGHYLVIPEGEKVRGYLIFLGMISVIGTGYLGATQAACIAELGFDVVGIDVDEERIQSLTRGEVPFYEPGLSELLQKNVANGRLSFSTDIAAIGTADLHFMCVGTPQSKESNAADLTYMRAALDAIAAYAKPGSLIVGKSTVPVGTAAELSARLVELGSTVELAWNPEFTREGFAVEDTLHPNRIVVGVTSARAENILKVFYQSFPDIGTPWIVADLPTAELVKVAANSFLATKISFINAMAQVCDAANGDVTVLAKAIGYDPRIGHRFLQAGIGFGGGCLPKDVRAFMARAEELGAKDAHRLLTEIDAINLRARATMIEIAAEYVDLSSAKVLVLGAAFKPDSDDIRDSPALEIAAGIAARGANVIVHDPKALGNAQKQFPQLGFSIDLYEAARGADMVLHLTEWREYREIKPEALGCVVKNKIILDGRNALDAERWRKAGWVFRSPGRVAPNPF